MERTVWKIVGRMGQQITIVNQHGDRAVVADGTMKTGCLISYPEVLCDTGEISVAKKRIAAEARARAEEEATVAALKVEISEMKQTISKMRQQMNDAFDETAKFRAENAHMAQEKVQLGNLPALADSLRQQLEASTRENKRLETENAVLSAKVEQEQAKAKEELLKFKMQMVAAPEWVKGTVKEYSDSALGLYTVHRQGGEVFFTIQNQKETKADAMFGKNVLRKERRGDYTYYALTAKTVRFKE